MAAASRRALLGAALAAPALAVPAGTLHLTIDTGWMDQAERIAAILRRREIRATLFCADEATFRGDRSLGPEWDAFWRARAAEGHVFGSHTWRHWYFGPDRGARVLYRQRGGRGREMLDAAGVAAELRHPIARLAELGIAARPLWRAPGGHTTPNVLAFARQAGLRHVGWSDAGFLGDELPADRYPNAALLSRALARLRDGDVMLMHWGIRSRRTPFADILDPLLAGLLDRGFRFAPVMS